MSNWLMSGSDADFRDHRSTPLHHDALHIKSEDSPIVPLLDAATCNSGSIDAQLTPGAKQRSDEFDWKLYNLDRYSKFLYEMIEVTEPERLLDLAKELKSGTDNLLEFARKHGIGISFFRSTMDSIDNRVNAAIKFASRKVQEGASRWREVLDVLWKVVKLVSGIAKVAVSWSPLQCVTATISTLA